LCIKLAGKNKRSEVVTELLKIPNLMILIKYLGVYDLFACTAFEDFQDYFKIAEDISRIENIEQLDIFLVQTPCMASKHVRLPSLIKLSTTKIVH
jgi:hypothetical protein